MKNKNLRGGLFMVAISCMMAGAAHAEDGLMVAAEVAADERGIVLNMVVSEEIEERNIVGNKITRLIDANSVVPGDLLVYVTTVSNRSQQLAENVAIVNPVPAHTTYLDGSAQGEGAMTSFSVDGAKNFDAVENLIVTDENGESRPATTQDYTHIRWLLSSLPANTEADVLFRTRLD